MKDKGLLKYKGTESKGAMHYIKYNDQYVSLTQKTSRKVKDITKENQLMIAFGLFSKAFEKVDVTIVEEETFVKEVFDFMKSNKHTHYKTYVDNLVVLSYLNV